MMGVLGGLLVEVEQVAGELAGLAGVDDAGGAGVAQEALQLGREGGLDGGELLGLSGGGLDLAALGVDAVEEELVLHAGTIGGEETGVEGTEPAERGAPQLKEPAGRGPESDDL